MTDRGRPILMPSLTLTPRGQLLFTVTEDALQPSAALSRKLESAFARGSGHGLFELGAGEVGTALPADFSYWRDLRRAVDSRPSARIPISMRRRQYLRPRSASSRSSPRPRRR